MDEAFSPSCFSASCSSLCDACVVAVRRLLCAFQLDAIQPADVDACFVHPPSPPNTGGEAEEQQPRVCICDLGVYTRNRNFRLAGSRKLNGSRVLWPVVDDRTVAGSFADAWPHRSQWTSTLVTYCSGDGSTRWDFYYLVVFYFVHSSSPLSGCFGGTFSCCFFLSHLPVC